MAGTKRDPSMLPMARKGRFHRMGKGLGWATVGAVILDVMVRGTTPEHQAPGTNILIFAIIAAGVYLYYRRQILTADADSPFWDKRSPWLLPFWILAGLAIIAIRALHQ